MNTTTTPSKRATPMTHTLPLRWEQLGVLLLAAGLAPSVFAGSLYYYNGDSQQRITPEPTQIAEFAPYGATSAARSASPTKAWKFVTLRAAGPGTADAAGGAKTSPVFREGDSPAGRLMALPGGHRPVQAGLDRHASERMAGQQGADGQAAAGDSGQLVRDSFVCRPGSTRFGQCHA